MKPYAVSNTSHQISLFISMAQSSSLSMATGEHLAFLRQEHRVELTQDHLRGEEEDNMNMSHFVAVVVLILHMSFVGENSLYIGFQYHFDLTGGDAGMHLFPCPPAKSS